MSLCVGDLIFWRDEKFGKHRFWEVQGVYLGGEEQESLIELKNLLEKPGVPGRTGNATTTFVPEPLLCSESRISTYIRIYREDEQEKDKPIPDYNVRRGADGPYPGERMPGIGPAPLAGGSRLR